MSAKEKTQVCYHCLKAPTVHKWYPFCTQRCAAKHAMNAFAADGNSWCVHCGTYAERLWRGWWDGPGTCANCRAEK